IGHGRDRAEVQLGTVLRGCAPLTAVVAVTLRTERRATAAGAVGHRLGRAHPSTGRRYGHRDAAGQVMTARLTEAVPLADDGSARRTRAHYSTVCGRTELARSTTRQRSSGSVSKLARVRYARSRPSRMSSSRNGSPRNRAAPAAAWLSRLARWTRITSGHATTPVAPLSTVDPVSHRSAFCSISTASPV